MNEKGYLNFTDFPLAVTLICLGSKLVTLNEDTKTIDRVNFVFEKNPEVEKIVAAYWAGSLLVEPKQFWNVSRELKSRIRLRG